MASRWRQDGPCGAKMVLRWATWRALGSNLVTFAESWARPLQKSDQLQNPRKTQRKLKFFAVPRRSWRPTWLILALGWTMLGNLVAILEQLCDCSIGESVSLDRFGFEKMRIAKNLVKHDENGPKMAPRWCEDGAMLAHVGALGRYLGPSWRSRAPSCRQVVAR